MDKKITRILFVCHGNICRSPMAEYVMKYLVAQKGLQKEFFIDSAAVSTEEIGNGVHRGTRSVLAKNAVPCGDHRARQMTKKDYEDFDYIIAMDSDNVQRIRRIVQSVQDLFTNAPSKIYKMLYFANEEGDVADPWYTGDFDATYRDVLAGCKGLLEHIYSCKAS